MVRVNYVLRCYEYVLVENRARARAPPPFASSAVSLASVRLQGMPSHRARVRVQGPRATQHNARGAGTRRVLGV